MVMSNEKLIREAFGFIEGSDPESARTTLIRDLVAALQAPPSTDGERQDPTEQDWRAAHQDGGVIFAKVRGSAVPMLLMRGKYGDWSSETKRYRSADVEEVISVYRWVPAGMQKAWSSEIVADFRRSEVPEPSAVEKAEWPDHWTTNEKLRDLHARWHDQKGNLLGREACGWEHCEFWDSAQFTLRLADAHIAGRGPQGEPSDAQALLTIRDDIVRNGGRADAAVLAGLERLASRAADVVAEEQEWDYGVIGAAGRMVNNGDYTIQQTHRRRKAGPWVPVKQEGAGI